jgi:hypothetical protein
MACVRVGVFVCVFVCVCVCVCMSGGAQARMLDALFPSIDSIQSHSNVSIRFGAALVYHGKDGRTTDLLRRYVTHRAYGFPFANRADIAERDAIFVPSGACS